MVNWEQIWGIYFVGRASTNPWPVGGGMWETGVSGKDYQIGVMQIGQGLQEKRRRQWHPTPVLLPGKSHGQRSLVGCSARGLEESDTTERLHFHVLLSCTGEGNGNPLQCSCLESPRDGGSWWAPVYGVAQSQTWLKRLCSSSSSSRSWD